MAIPKLTKLELRIMETFWSKGNCSIREVQEDFAVENRPAYTTIQSTVYRLETKNVLVRVKKIGNSHIFSATISRRSAERRLVDDLLSLFGGRLQPVVAHLVQSRHFSQDDLREARELLRVTQERRKPK